MKSERQSLKHTFRFVSDREVQEMKGYYTRYSFRVTEGEIKEFVSEEEAEEYTEEETD